MRYFENPEDVKQYLEKRADEHRRLAAYFSDPNIVKRGLTRTGAAQEALKNHTSAAAYADAAQALADINPKLAKHLRKQREAGRLVPALAEVEK